VPLAAGAACWVVVSAVRGAAVWLAPSAEASGRPPTPVRARDGTALDGLAVLAELMGPPAGPAAETGAEPLALEVGGTAVDAPPADGGARSFDITAALQAWLASGGDPGQVPLTFRAIGPGNLTVYPPVVEFDL